MTESVQYTRQQPRMPRILVLMATHNGASYLRQQLDSVLQQDGVEVSILASDDDSQDETLDILRSYEAQHPAVTILKSGRYGSAARNFAHLIRQADIGGFDAIALCDQDDIWVAHKLARHYEILSLDEGLDNRGPYSAVSSNVAAFSADGSEVLVVKNQRQRVADYIFESGGPGSTFLFQPEAFQLIQRELADPNSAASKVESHDWLAYALVRASGRRWFIDGEPTVLYRQHDSNALGANEGLSQHLRRFTEIRNGNYRRNILGMLAATERVATGRDLQRIHWLRDQITQNTLCSRLRLARHAQHFRRRRRDQLVLKAMLILGLW